MATPNSEPSVAASSRRPMKYLAIALTACAALFVGAQTATSQAPAPDNGEANLLLIACHTMTDAAVLQGLLVKNCRRAAPDEINGYRAKIHVRIMTDWGPFFLTLAFYKSQWGITSAVQDSGPTKLLR